MELNQLMLERLFTVWPELNYVDFLAIMGSWSEAQQGAAVGLSAHWQIPRTFARKNHMLALAWFSFSGPSLDQGSKNPPEAVCSAQLCWCPTASWLSQQRILEKWDALCIVGQAISPKMWSLEVWGDLHDSSQPAIQRTENSPLPK